MRTKRKKVKYKKMSTWELNEKKVEYKKMTTWELNEKKVESKKMSTWELNGKTSWIYKDEYMRTKRKNKLNIKRWVHEN